MSLRKGMACAAVLLFVAAGCSAGSFLLSWVGPSGKQQVVSGSIEEVAARLRLALRKIDIIVAVNPMLDGTIKLNGQTKSGQRFALVLKRHKTNAGEKTAVSIEWVKDADEQFWAAVLDLLVPPTPIADNAPVSAEGIPSGR